MGHRQEKEYDGKEKPATTTIENNATGAFEDEDVTITYTKKGEAGTCDVPKDAGNYTATVTVGGASITIGFTISKATPEVNIITAKGLTYNGSAQALITDGWTSGGTLEYVLASDAPVPEVGWSTNVPERIPAGTYHVWYRVVGNDNYNDVAATYVDVTIAGKSQDVTAPQTRSLTYTGSAQQLVTPAKVSRGTVWYALGGDADTAETDGWSVTKTYGDADFINPLKNTGDGTVKYESDNESVATVGDDGTVTVKGAGSAKISAVVTDGANYSYDVKTASYDLSVAKARVLLAYGTPSVTKAYGDAAFTNHLTNPSGAAATYRSTNASVATVDAAGRVTIRGLVACAPRPALCLGHAATLRFESRRICLCEVEW